ncbi:MAG: DHHA2 domain-containing protein, partial [Sphaerochaetaceae bacterium]
LDAERTRKAIFIASEPVGSTCTIVYHQYLRWSVRVDRLTALILLAGIISDTVILKSPTTTPQDLRAVNKLAKIAKIENIYEFGEELFSVASLLNKADPRQVIEGDFKTYQEGETHFGIGQVEVTTLTKVDEVKEKYIRQLEATKQRFGLDWAMLLVTDVIAESSILLTTSYPKKERALLYPMEGKGKYLLKGVLSRKKQLLPEVISVLEEGD